MYAQLDKNSKFYLRGLYFNLGLLRSNSMASIISELRWNRRSVISNFIANEESIDADLREGELGQEGAERLYYSF